MAGPVMSRTAVPAASTRRSPKVRAHVHEEARGQERGRDPERREHRGVENQKAIERPKLYSRFR
jgi:hypothetical protein